MVTPRIAYCTHMIVLPSTLSLKLAHNNSCNNTRHIPSSSPSKVSKKQLFLFGGDNKQNNTKHHGRTTENYLKPSVFDAHRCTRRRRPFPQLTTYIRLWCHRPHSSSYVLLLVRSRRSSSRGRNMRGMRRTGLLSLQLLLFMDITTQRKKQEMRIATYASNACRVTTLTLRVYPTSFGAHSEQYT